MYGRKDIFYMVSLILIILFSLDLFEECVLTWRLDDDKFVETRAVKTIEHCLKEKNCVLVVARPGNNKLSITRHIAIKLQDDEGYDIIPIVLGPSNIFDYYDPSKRQVFTVDNLCGKGRINDETLSIWSLDINEIVKLLCIEQREYKFGSLKIIFTCELDIYNDEQFNRLETLNRFLIKLSDIPPSDYEKIKMIRKYVREKIAVENLILGYDQNTINLICKLAEDKQPDTVIEIFRNPQAFIKTNLVDLKSTYNKQFRIIAVCAMLGGFNIELLRDNMGLEKEKERLHAISLEFSIDLTKETAKARLREQLDILQEIYLTRIGDLYHFKHEIILEVAVITCGREYVDEFIRHGSCALIRDKFMFECLQKSNDETVIFVSRENEKRYFHRLLSDLEQGYVSTALHNKQLIFDDYREKFCNYCYSRKTKVIHSLQLNKKHSERNNTKKNNAAVEQNMFTKETIELQLPLIEAVWEGYKDIVEMLLEMECEIDAVDNRGKTAIYVACHLGKSEIIELLLDKRANFGISDFENVSPISAASKEGFKDSVKLLLEKGADMSTCDIYGHSALFAACESGHKSVVELLLKSGANISQCDNVGCSPLFIASYRGRKDVVELLLYEGANVNKTDKSGMSPLFAASMKGQVNVVNRLLKEETIDTCKCDSYDRSPLFVACEEGQRGTVRALLDHDTAQIKKCIVSCDWKRRSPLFIACLEERVEIVEMLVEKSDINCCDEDDRSPLFIACEKKNVSIVKILLEKKADVNKCDVKLRSPLYVSCREGNLDIVEMLCKYEANIFLRNKWGDSPLYVACREGNIQIVEFLISEGSSIDEQDINGQTPLLVACEEGNLEIVKILLNNGADKHLCDNDNRSPLHVAEQRGHGDVNLELLYIRDEIPMCRK